MFLAHLTEDTRWFYRKQNALALQSIRAAVLAVWCLPCALIAYWLIKQLRTQLLQLIPF